MDIGTLTKEKRKDKTFPFQHPSILLFVGCCITVFIRVCLAIQWIARIMIKKLIQMN